MLKGIDVSEHQGRIDWEKVKSQVDFVMLRAGFGHNNIDKQFRRNISECNRLEIPVGIYWFSYAYTEEMARQEARYALQSVKDYRLDYPISFDLEYDTLNYARKNGVNIGKSLATKMVRAFCLEIERNGYYAMNYTNRDFMRNKFNMEDINRFKIWYAWYNSKLDTSDHVGMWQYSENGRVRGIYGSSVDMNYSLIDFAKVIREKGLNNSKNFKPYSSSKSSSSSSNSSSGSKLWQREISGEEVKALQHQINVQGYGDIKEDGYFGEDTLKCCPMVREGAKGNITRLIQQRLLNRGYTSLLNHGGADGCFGAGTTTAIKNLQRNFGLSVDGIVGKDTWKALYSK